MVTIKLTRGQDGRIRRFSVSGHAKYADHGKDIVCAGVSAVTIGAMNAIEKLTGLVPDARMKSGWLSAEAPTDADDSQSDQVQLLLEGMVVSLEAITEAYGKYVRIQEVIE